MAVAAPSGPISDHDSAAPAPNARARPSESAMRSPPVSTTARTHVEPRELRSAAPAVVASSTVTASSPSRESP